MSLWILTGIAAAYLCLVLAFPHLFPGLWKRVTTSWVTLLLNASGIRFCLLLAVPMAYGLVLSLPWVVVVRRWGRDFRRYWRWHAYRCIRCDYDLRAHHAGEKCPECASVIPPEPPPPRLPGKPLALKWFAIQLIFLLLIITALAIMNDQRPILEMNDFFFLVGIPFTFFVAHYLMRRQRYQRWILNQCMHCGQDLRPHTPGQLCPKCGMTIPSVSK
jgi:hypothetical protein